MGHFVNVKLFVPTYHVSKHDAQSDLCILGHFVKVKLFVPMYVSKHDAQIREK